MAFEWPENKNQNKNQWPSNGLRMAFEWPENKNKNKNQIINQNNQK